jgi:thymidylate synthase
MNNLDRQYQALLKDILSYGVDKNDRTGTGTKSIFGYMIHHNMQNGFPLLTTKKMPLKTIATELMWFLMGDTNIKYLVDNGVHIWNGDAYKNYLKNFTPPECPPNLDVQPDYDEPMSKDMFIYGIKTDAEFAREWGELGPVYGAQWRGWFKPEYVMNSDSETTLQPVEVDQITNLINELKTNPDSRRLMVNAWNVGELDQMVLPPCHYGFQVYTRELSLVERGEIFRKTHPTKSLDDFPSGKMDVKEVINVFDKANIPTRAISLSWNQRSVDVFLGLPFNIASYGLLLEMIAREVNMVPEHLIGHLGDTHLYLDHLDQAQQQLERIPRELPILKMSSGHNFRAALKGKADEIDVNDFMLIGYNPHPHIKAPLSN